MQTKFTQLSICSFLALFSLLSISLMGCQEKKAQQMPTQKVQTVKVTNKHVPYVKIHVGQLYGVRDIPIRARVDGYLEGVHFKEGTLVKKGKLLYTIDPQPFQASEAAKRSAVAEAEVNAARAKKDLDRMAPLVKIKAVSQSDYDAAKAEYDAAIAAVSAAKANLKISQLDLGYAKISSPITGIIGRTEAKVGEYVGRDPNPVILNKVSRTDTILVQFFLDEKEYLEAFRHRFFKKKKMKEGVPEERDSVEFELILADNSTFEYKGQYDFLDREVDPNTGAMLVQASFPNPDLFLRPGQFARVKTTMKSEKASMVIPQRSVIDFQGQKMVYVVDKDNKVKQQKVKLGFAYKDLYTLLEGLEEGDQIIFEGLQKVREGMTVAPELVEFKSKAE
ncbi:efflux RND transporter periplasmic adaptor subunit [Persicobacter diffluens]|uniref:MexE family multidrug efflux RND transporter periplasmic adaptor subunit n=1 Tax=Persicobacter diffluens TaxID=981 RepID=A0AAN4VZJ0_9BACT|nr:MexE family multidrug efflux RND transporter periplasmic adaptor subunit [Persicobacter diffluens]